MELHKKDTGMEYLEKLERGYNIMIKKIINTLKYPIKKYYWRIKNRDNLTFMVRNFNIKSVTVGKGTYGPLNVFSFGNIDERLSIGNYCCIGPNTTFLLGGEHNYQNFSIYPFSEVLMKKGTAKTKGPIIIEDDVWLGYGTIVLSGVKIGQGAVIGAGTVVAEDIPPYAVYVNGRIVKYRFSNEIIEKMLQFDFLKLEKNNILKNMDILEKTNTLENTVKILNIVKKE